MASIFPMISFNSAPVFILLIPDVGWTVIYIMSICCILGFFLSCNLPPGPPICCETITSKVSWVVLYMMMVCFICMITIQSFIVESNDYEKICWLLGFICYFTGSVIYLNESIDPWPTVFGYHEVFHLFTCVAAVFTWMVNYSVVVRKQLSIHENENYG
jgi:hemolysin III